MRNRMKRIGCMLLAALFLLPAAGLAETADIIYESAENLLAEKKYAEAAQAYDSIINYRDAADCGMYARALEAMVGEKIEEARTVFEYLGSFRDCEMLCYYADILQMEAAGEYREAIQACRVVPYSYYGRIREKLEELKSKYEYHGYDYAHACGKYVIVRHAQTDLMGVIDMEGRVLVPCEWDGLGYRTDDYVVVSEKVDSESKFGIASVADGKMTASCQWDGIELIVENCAVVRSDKRLYGLISAQTGEIILPCEYDWIDCGPNGYAIIRKKMQDGKSYGIVDMRDGQIVTDGEAYIEMLDSAYPITVAVDQSGAVHLFAGGADRYPQETTEGLEILDNALAFVSGGASDSTKIYVTEDRVLETDESSVVYHELTPESKSEFRAIRKDGLYGFADASGAVVIACEWDGAESFIHGFGLVEKDEKWGCIDASGRLVLDCEWDHIQILSGNTALCFNGEMWYGSPQEGENYVVDLISGTKSAVDWKCESWGYGVEGPEGLLKVKSGDRYGVVNVSGHPVIPCSMRQIDLLTDGYLRVEDESAMYGVYNTLGDVVIPFEHSWLDYSDGTFVLITGGRKFIDQEEAYLTIVDAQGNTLF